MVPREASGAVTTGTRSGTRSLPAVRGRTSAGNLAVQVPRRFRQILERRALPLRAEHVLDHVPQMEPEAEALDDVDHLDGPLIVRRVLHGIVAIAARRHAHAIPATAAYSASAA